MLLVLPKILAWTWTWIVAISFCDISLAGWRGSSGRRKCGGAAALRCPAVGVLSSATWLAWVWEDSLNESPGPSSQGLWGSHSSEHRRGFLWGEGVKAELKVKVALWKGRCRLFHDGQQLSVTLPSAAQ